MNFLRAAGISVLVYLCTFVIGILTAMALGVDMETPMEQMPLAMCVVSIVGMIVLTALFAMWYFKGNKRAGAREGFFFGLTLMAVGFALDALFMISYKNWSAAPMEMDLTAYYRSWVFLASLAGVLLTATLMGWCKGKSGKKKK